MAVGSSNDFDLVVLGAGTGGYTAAFRAAQLGLKVALVDEDKLGGTCLHRGCIPTKALLESAAFADRIRHAKDYGIALPGEATIDYPTMAARRDSVVKRMYTGLKTLVGKNNVTWIAGRGRLDGPGKVHVSQPGEDGTPGGGGDRVLNATDIILATGSRVKSLPGVGPEGKDPAELRAEVMLVATGRAANIEDIGLETTKVETDRGVIKVNGRMRTKEPHVYAIGDIVGGLWLAHTAGHEGITAAHTIAGDPDVHDFDYNKQPRATYCRPEIASIGLTEAQCVDRGIPIKTGKVPFQAIAKAIIGGDYEGFAKVISHAETNDTLGIHIVGPHATDLIAEASLGFTLDATPWEYGAATHAHPTLSEVLGEAAMAVDGRSINF